jgi:soluble lytic murein transglycosylase
MRARAAAVLFCACYFSVLATAAAALDLDAARRDGAVLAEALALGERGDWPAAESRVAGQGDRLLSDIVLWRKLRAGEGSFAEYRGFVARRSTWPGQDHLRRAVTGESPSGGGSRLDARALRNWQSFSRAWERRLYDDAARLLEQVTVDARGLGEPALWADRRRRLARREARMGRHTRAYHLASRHHLAPSDGYAYADCEWIAGWVALRKLEEPERALAHFQRFEAAVETPISVARAGYWLGRTYAAMDEPARALRWYSVAAEHQTAFYGQLAAQEIGARGDARLAARDLPNWRVSPALRSDDVRLAAILHFAGEDSLAFQTFSHLGREMSGGAALGALGSLALELEQPHVAVRIAKHAARKGVVIHPAYYPLHDLAGYAREIEPALAMSIARQETELNPRAISPAGARGLMQLMPSTAQKVAGWLGEPYSRSRLTEDWRYNARLGQRYLAERIRQFGGSYVLAAAAYNAGAHRVDDWVGRYGDPRLPGVDVIDWIETIPFRETRNYVQRVIEGLYVYRARLSGEAGQMTILQDLTRGARG